MKRLVFLLSAVALSACSGTTTSSGTVSGSTGRATTATSTTTGSTTSTTTTGNTSSGSTSRGTTSGGSTGLTTAGSSGSTGLATAGSSGSTGLTTAGSSGSTGLTTGGSSGSTGVTTTGGGSSGSTGSCNPVPVTGTPPANDNCSAPAPLTLNTTVQGDTTFAQNDFAYADSVSSCTGFVNSGPDVVYAFSPTATGDYTVTVTPVATADGGTWDPAAYVLTSCPTTCATTPACTAGADRGFGGDPETFNFSGAAGTPYYLVVDRYSGRSTTSRLGGPFSIAVTPYVDAGGPTPPDAGPPQINDSCGSIDAGLDLVLAPSPDGGKFAQVFFDTVGYHKDSHSATGGACNGYGSAPDEVFHVVLAQAAPSLTATIVRTVTDGGYKSPMVYIRSNPCVDQTDNLDGGASSELACALVSDAGSPTATTASVPAGDYYIWVDGYGSAQGAGSLTVTVP